MQCFQNNKLKIQFLCKFFGVNKSQQSGRVSDFASNHRNKCHLNVIADSSYESSLKKKGNHEGESKRAGDKRHGARDSQQMLIKMQ